MMPGHSPLGGKKNNKNVIYEQRSVMCKDGVCRRFSIKIDLNDMFARAGQNEDYWDSRHAGITLRKTLPLDFKYIRDVPEDDPKLPNYSKKKGNKQ